MNKPQIRNKLLRLRKKNNFKNLEIDFKCILQILKKEKILGKIIGGYYPFNCEVNGIQILKKHSYEFFPIVFAASI